MDEVTKDIEIVREFVRRNVGGQPALDALDRLAAQSAAPVGEPVREEIIHAIQLSYARDDLEPTSAATLALYRADAEHAADAVLDAISLNTKEPSGSPVGWGDDYPEDQSCT